ncbi:MAG: family 43 glycosylhydrolase [Pedobacter sp.]|nr:family 43 glycosylhydrolase [Pedobacter sp.]
MNKPSKYLFFILLLLGSTLCYPQRTILKNLKSPIIFKGDEKTAFRDPAVLYHNNTMYLFFTLIRTEEGHVYSYTAMRKSKDLKNWSPLKIITPRDMTLDFSSPGNVVRFNNEWVLCLQTYPRPNYKVGEMPRFGTGDARIYLTRSKDLEHWSTPEIMKVKGPRVSFNDMGRMIDPYLLEDESEPGKWWCFYKQNGVSMSYSYDLRKWNFFGYTESGENACVLYENKEYVLIHSLKNGIGIKKSKDLKTWQDWGPLITLGQNNWSWAKGRITAGTVINLKKNKRFGKYVMFFHASGPKTEEEGDFDKNASIGIAWSDDLSTWDWPK